jgi:hypothetical protein
VVASPGAPPFMWVEAYLFGKEGVLQGGKSYHGTKTKACVASPGGLATLGAPQVKNQCYPIKKASLGTF